MPMADAKCSIQSHRGDSFSICIERASSTNKSSCASEVSKINVCNVCGQSERNYLYDGGHKLMDVVWTA